MGEKGSGKKKSEGEKKGDDNGAITVVLKLDMHCDGCAKKVKRCVVKNFDGVESVKVDWETSKLTVVGKVDPIKVKEKVEEKTKKKVELISPQPNKASKEASNGGGDKKPDENKSDKKPDEKKSEKKPDEQKSDENKSEKKPGKKNSEEKKSDEKKPDEKKDNKPKEIQVSTVVLKTRIHCEGCAQKIRKIVGKSQGIEDVKVDLQTDTITIKGTMDMKELLPYLNVKLKRQVELAPSPKKEEGGATKDKKPKDGNGPSEKPKEGGKSDKPKEGGGGEKKDKSASKQSSGGGGGGEGSSVSQENTTRIEINKFEYGGYPPYGPGYGVSYAYDPRQQQQQGYGVSYAYDPRQQQQQQQQQGYGYQVVEDWHASEYSQPPQMFSDENPNACSVM